MAFRNKLQSLVRCFRRALNEKRDAAQVEVITVPTFRRLALCTLDVGLDQSRGYRAHNTCRNLVLQIEDFVQVAFELVRPQMGTSRSVDELPRDPHASTRFAHTAFQYVANTKFASYLLDVDGLTFEVNDELRAITNSDLKRDSAVMMSSTIPSAKYSCSGSPLMF
jgi:hypothetical protein